MNWLRNLRKKWLKRKLLVATTKKEVYHNIMQIAPSEWAYEKFVRSSAEVCLLEYELEDK